ncbi:hypothetical protein D3C83_104260 [compost metagenome]
MSVVSTLYSVSSRDCRTSNCSSPTTARIGSDFSPSCSTKTCMAPSSSSCSSPFWNCFCRVVTFARKVAKCSGAKRGMRSNSTGAPEETASPI